jgi:hypothetical protein
MITVDRVVSQAKAAKYAFVIMSVPNNPQKKDTQTRLIIDFFDIPFTLSHHHIINGLKRIAPRRCSTKTIFSAGNSYKFGRIKVPSKLQAVAAMIIAIAPIMKFLSIFFHIGFYFFPKSFIMSFFPNTSSKMTTEITHKRL